MFVYITARVERRASAKLLALVLDSRCLRFTVHKRALEVSSSCCAATIPDVSLHTLQRTRV